MSPRVGDISVFHLSRTSQDRLLARVDFKVRDSVASAEEVKTDGIRSLSMVKSDLNAACAEAGSLERIFITLCLDNMLNLSNFL